jgi:uncharacterized protein (DUF2237 family)
LLQHQQRGHRFACGLCKGYQGVPGIFAIQRGFPGLKPGDQWCLCAARWQEALEAGAAPRVVLQATHAAALKVVKLQDLKKYALDLV